MDIVVYIKDGENEELRYAIRTWCQNLAFRHLYVIGGPKPSWLEPDIYVENPTTKSKMLQCYDNVCKAMDDDRLSEDVLLLMDDVFVINYVGVWNVNYNRGTMMEQYDRGTKRFGKNPYDDQVKFTNDMIKETKPSPLSFEEHAPFLCNRKLMLQVLDAMKGEKIERLLYRSIYGNTFNSKTKFKLDVKLITGSEKFNSNEPVISTSSAAFNGAAGNVIKDWFPAPSRYEK